MIARRRDGAILRQLRTVYNLGSIGDLTDGQLLERFATDRDEIAELAFSALVERHEAMVWRACLAILRDEHQAEDAFQATFLVLVHKARSLWVRDSLGPWLHQVACRTASCLRARAIRRRMHEHRRAERDAARPAKAGARRDLDLDAAIHEEVGRLPEKYRAPLVLCDLEGRTHQEAARALGWPIGTVKSRQAQGRKRIRDRLVRRGMGPAVAGSIVEALRQGAVAAPPLAIARSIVTAAIRRSSWPASGLGVSSHVLSLTRRGLRTMMWIQFRSLGAATLALGIATGGASVYVRDSQEPSPKSGGPPSTSPATAIERAPRPATAESRANLRAQRLATRRARAASEIARLTREIAELAIEEYEEVGYPQDLATAEGQIKLAESDLGRSQDRLAWSGRMIEKGNVSKSVKHADELAVERARFDLEQAGTSRKVLVDYTRRKTIKALQVEVEKARADELAKGATWDLEKAKEVELEPQLGRDPS